MNPNNLSTRIDKSPQSILDLLKSCCGNFCQKQEIYDGIVALVEENKRLNGKNLELVAQVEMLRAALEATRQPHMDYIPKLDKTARQVLDATPAQCLRQIQADAGRAGFVAGAKYVYTSRELGYFPDVLELVSLDYVERVKSGEL